MGDEFEGVGLQVAEAVVAVDGALEVSDDGIGGGGVAVGEVGADGEAVEVFVVSASEEAGADGFEGEGWVFEFTEASSARSVADVAPV